MKRKFFLFLCCLLYGFLMAQTVDVTIYSQNTALHDTTAIPLAPHPQIASYPSVTETYQIPAFDLYYQFWDVEHLRSRLLDIPFSNDRLMLILVQSENNPFVVPCVFDEIMLGYGLTKKGIFHTGVDLKVEPQTLVKSCFDGVVRMAKNYGDYGLIVVVRHYNGMETVYAHLDKLCVKPGQIVRSGDVIGQTGRSGNTKECILHLETRFMNECFNPEMIIDFVNEKLVKNTIVLMPTDFNIVALDQIGNISSPSRSVPTQSVINSTPIVTTIEDSAEEDIDRVPVNLQKAFDGEEEYHVVQAGETLYRISVNYQTTIANLMRLNNITNGDKIVPGQRIRVR